METEIPNPTSSESDPRSRELKLDTWKEESPISPKR